MIDPKELRIGNIINYTGNHLFNGVFDEQFARYMFDVGDEWRFLEPLPLTEEKLLRFGFDFQYKSGYTFKYADQAMSGDYHVYKIGNLYCKLFHDTNTLLLKGVSVKFVHRLQNLYFELEDKELTIKTSVGV